MSQSPVTLPPPPASRRTPFIPEDAPFSAGQRAWLNGYLAGMFSGDSSSATPPSAPAIPVTILFASQSGNSEALAKKIAKSARAEGLQTTIRDLIDFPVESISSERHVLLVTSTFGDGEPPDSAKALHAYLHADNAPRLEQLEFAVLGLGDSSYPDFNSCAKEFTARFETLGAKPLCPPIYCDVDFEADAETWRQSAFAALAQKKSPAAAPIPPAPSITTPPAPTADPEKALYDKRNPYPARVIACRNLNAEGSGKDTRHLELSLGTSGPCYEPGDALGVRPANSTRLVDAVIAASGLREDAPTQLPDKRVAPLFEALRFHYEISRLTPSFVEACARLSKSGQALAAARVSNESMTAYSNGRTILDAIEESGTRFADTEQLIAPLRQLQPRLYSISSSPRAHPGEVHLTVGTVRWEANDKQLEGVCSNFIARLTAGNTCPVFVHHNPNFRLPTDGDRPLIMVGPGTGIAPFRAFIEDRALLGHRGENWLFFGDRSSTTDFLYADEFSFWQKKGVLTRLDTAFSRDQQEKIYVQNRMEENGRELYDWLERGATFCVCGDAKLMARDVDAALHRIIQSHSGKGEEFAAEYVNHLRSTKRYLRDVY